MNQFLMQQETTRELQTFPHIIVKLLNKREFSVTETRTALDLGLF